jgi:hypothetical protein
MSYAGLGPESESELYEQITDHHLSGRAPHNTKTADLSDCNKKQVMGPMNLNLVTGDRD